ncbi:MAG: chemotaxis response regulator protein-glutamate methylesterase [Gammaproteobacteria bacterium]|nr:chemotaxis response regulator protein-glutamate methylesterase [Gammaproteobacteria bacterium]
MFKKTEKIKTLVVDDSAVVRQALSDILRSDPGIELLAAVANPIFAMHRMERQWPDVIILDIEMPEMDGLTFLRKIMAEHPTPVIICSSMAEKGTQASIQILSSGAVEVITKPKIGARNFLYEAKLTLIDAVKAAAHANLTKIKRIAEMSSVRGRAVSTKPGKPMPGISTEVIVEPKHSADVILAPRSKPLVRGTTEQIIAMGASTGGTQALEFVLMRLPLHAPGIVIVQHMPGGFTAAFAKRLNGICDIVVKEAENGDRVARGQALIAPGDQHILLRRNGSLYHVELKSGPVVNRHRPSVDVLFRSVAQNAGKNAVGVIMTGMGDDGARGMQEMHNAGAFSIAQNEETCVVYGMPKEAVKRGAVDKIMPLESIAIKLMELVSGD